MVEEDDEVSVPGPSPLGCHQESLRRNLVFLERRGFAMKVIVHAVLTAAVGRPSWGCVPAWRMRRVPLRLGASLRLGEARVAG
jgi:hypothetical protein